MVDKIPYDLRPEDGGPVTAVTFDGAEVTGRPDFKSRKTVRAYVLHKKTCAGKA